MPRVSSDVLPTTIPDAELLAAQLDPADRLEVERAGELDVRGAVIRSVALSVEPLSMFVAGELAGITGVIPQKWGGQFWFLSTPVVRRYPLAFMRAAKLAWSRVSAGHQFMGNVIDAKHAPAHRMARHFGFDIGASIQLGPAASPFDVITWRNPSWEPTSQQAPQ